MTTLADVRKAFEDNPLPEKLSDCILVALEDLERCEAHERYEIKMSMFHNPALSPPGMCAVCLAGATIAPRANYTPMHVPIDELDDYTKRRVHALDAVKGGRISTAFDEYLGQRAPDRIDGFVVVTQYHRDPAAFKSDLRKIAALLKEHGE